MSKNLKIDSYFYEKAFNTPLLIEPGKCQMIARYLERRFGMNGQMPSKEAFLSRQREDDDATQIYQNVAVVPILGTLVNRGGFMEAESGILSYRGIRAEILKAAEDRKIDAIVLDIDSGGGEVEGNFDLARLIRQINDEVKPVVAVANGSAFSGAYSLGVAAGSFFVTETGGVGSVGVVIQHVDFSEANEMAGIKVTNVTFGERKAELSEDFPLSPEAREMLQNEANRIGEIFVSHVAQMRGITEDVVKNTEASLLFGEDAVKMGFVDGIISFDDLIQSLTTADFPASSTEATMEIKTMFGKKTNQETDPKKVNEETPAAGEGEGAEAPEAGAEEGGEEQPGEGVPATETPDVEGPEKAAQITEMCTKAGMPERAAYFIRQDYTLAQVTAEVDRNAQIKQVCTLAGKPDRAEAFISSGKSVKQVQADLIKEASDEQDKTQISNTQTPEQASEDVETARNVVLEDVEARKKKAEAQQASK